MAVFWFAAGGLAIGALAVLALKGPSRTWWQWLLIALFDAWCVFGAAMAATTFAEGNAKGGWALLAIALVLSVAFLAVLRVLLRLGKGTAAAPQAAAKGSK